MTVITFYFCNKTKGVAHFMKMPLQWAMDDLFDYQILDFHP